MTPNDIKKAVREATGNGFMSDVKLAIVEALEPLFEKINKHDLRIKALEVKDGVCKNHEEMVKRTHKAFFNNWVVHVQWFAITVLVGSVVWLLKCKQAGM